jgi:hypothetical protein
MASLVATEKKRARMEAPGPLSAVSSVFGTLPDGTSVSRFDLSNGSITASFLDYGATLLSFLAPDKDGNTEVREAPAEGKVHASMNRAHRVCVPLT